MIRLHFTAITISGVLCLQGCKAPEGSDSNVKRPSKNQGTKGTDAKENQPVDQVTGVIRELQGSVSFRNVTLFNSKKEKISQLSLTTNSTTDTNIDFSVGICASEPIRYGTINEGALVFDSKGRSVQHTGGSDNGLGPDFKNDNRCSGLHYSLVNLKPGSYKIVAYLLDVKKCEEESKSICAGNFIKTFSEFVPSATSTKVWDLVVSP